MKTSKVYGLKPVGRAANQKGFSLVEVALALGIICAALIPLLGLMSVGFKTMKDSNAEVRASIIAQKIIAEAQMVPFAQLQGQTYSLDYEGNEVGEANQIFRVMTTVVKNPEGGLLDSPNAARVKIIITGPPLGNASYVLAATIANMGG